MPIRTNVVYRYDGSFDGLMCCVFESFRAKALPFAVETAGAQQETLFPVTWIETDARRAERVKRAIPTSISREANEAVNRVFLSCQPEKEMLILRFLHFGFQVGAKAMRLTTDEVVHEVSKTVQNVGNEAHFSLEFLRFSQYGEYLAAEISPKNNILPLIVGHFCDRLPDENFIIYDKRHKTAFLHRNDGETQFIHDADIAFPEADESERNYRRLWRHFYETIAIEGRINHKLRQTHMSKRFWPNMTEFQTE